MNAPLLSLIVPTRDGSQTLKATLTSAVAQASSDYEIVVSDNMSQDGTRQIVEAFGDPRIRYVNTARRLSMCDNYEFAFDHAEGAYTLIIGNDDAVIPGALDQLLASLRSQPEPLIHMWPLHIYEWPANGIAANVAYLAPQNEPNELDLKKKARSVMGLGGWKYYELPSPYHSAIPRELLLRVRERTGRIFNSTQPDVFTAMALPAFADRAINLGHTVTLNGRSAGSNGLGFVRRSARKNIERFVREYGDYSFHETLLQSAPATVNMIPDAVLRARDYFPELYEGTSFNFSAMWAYVCRIGFMDYSEVVRSRASIARAHPFSLAEFLRFAAIHRLAVVRRHILDAWTQRTELRTPTAPDIWQFVRGLAPATAWSGK